VIRVGAPSESEMKAKKDALDDAISATKAAVAEGIVPGGGLALLRCVDAVAKVEESSEGDERTGVQSCGARSRRRRARSPRTPPWTAAWSCTRCWRRKATMGFDAARNEYVDLYEAGIIDPTKVVRIALENAVSVASILLLTEATMTELPEKDKPLPAEMPEM
jgi:chaperonin GroEL